MNALDGSGKKNLSNNGSAVDDYCPVFSPDGTKIAYTARASRPPTPRATRRVYRMNALTGRARRTSQQRQRRLRLQPVFSPDGTKIAYESEGKQTSNSQGDEEIYVMNALDG